MRRKSVTYFGDLAKPLPALEFVHGGLYDKFDVDHPENKRLLEGQWREITRRMLLLCDHYEVKHFNWPALAYALAREHVPGLRVQQRRSGAPTKWGPLDIAELCLEVDQLRARKRLSLMDACRQLAKSHWGTKLRGRNKAEALRKLTYKVDPRWKRVAADANALPFDLGEKID